MIELPSTFYQQIVNPTNVNTSCSLLGPAEKTQTAEWQYTILSSNKLFGFRKNLIKEKQKQLLQKLDTGKFFKAPKL